jgi:hypothetical protein
VVRRKGSLWDVRSFDAFEAAERWKCDVETATEILFGAEGFLERGLVQSLNGKGRVVVTDAGLALAASVSVEALA